MIKHRWLKFGGQMLIIKFKYESQLDKFFGSRSGPIGQSINDDISRQDKTCLAHSSDTLADSRAFSFLFLDSEVFKAAHTTS
jgi:hypothetical protein